MKQCNGIKLEISKIQPTNTMLSEIRTKIIQKDKIIHIYVYTHYPCYSKAVSTESKLLVIKSYDMKILYVCADIFLIWRVILIITSLCFASTLFVKIVLPKNIFCLHQWGFNCHLGVFIIRQILL